MSSATTAARASQHRRATIPVNTIKTLFLDIGGVLLSNGWQQDSRELACKHFALDFESINQRHKLVFETFENGKMTLDEYLDLVIFNKKRRFSKKQFSVFMLKQTHQTPGMFRLFNELMKLKKNSGFKVIAVSNEARELNEYRIHTYGLNHLIDFFASSCYLHKRKPNKEIFSLAIDMAQTDPRNCVYIDDQKLFVEVASTLGIKSIHHLDGPTTLKSLKHICFKQ